MRQRDSPFVSYQLGAKRFDLLAQGGRGPVGDEGVKVLHPRIDVGAICFELSHICHEVAAGRVSDDALLEEAVVDLERGDCVVLEIDAQCANKGLVKPDGLHHGKCRSTQLAGEDGLQKLMAYLRSFSRLKIQHIQFNVVDRKTLLDAQAHPEKHKNLVVRVAGYSALFVELSKAIQDDIINRTEHVL